MGARTAITPVALTHDAFTAEGSGNSADATNGNTIADPGPNHLLLIIANAGTAARTVTVRASSSGNDATGAAQSSQPWNTVYTQATRGDLVVTAAAGTTYVVPPLTSDRFTQPDGSLSLDYDAATGLTVYAFALPYNRLGGATLA
jgi:hypothetical protein